MTSERETLINVLFYIACINDRNGVNGIKVRRRIAKAIHEADNAKIEDIYRRLGEEIQLKTIGIVGGEVI